MNITLEALTQNLPSDIKRHVEKAYYMGKQDGYRERQREVESAFTQLLPDLDVTGTNE